HHHVACLDHRIGLLSLRELELVNGFVGDRRGHRRAADVDAHMRGGLTLPHIDDRSLEQIARTELHRILLPGLESRYGTIPRTAQAVAVIDRGPSGAPEQYAALTACSTRTRTSASSVIA